MPGIFGLVDGTHIAISGLHNSIEASYVNRKGFHSINVQIICDCDLLILSANARYPGSSHDSYVWKSSKACAHMMNEYDLNSESGLWLLGDSGYPLQPWLMTPYMGPGTNQEQHYNKVHAQTRSKVERCIGVLKTRFRCLLGERKLRYNPERVAKIILSCVVLHNFMIIRKVHGDLEIHDAERVRNNNSTNNTNNSGNVGAEYLQHGRQIRNSLAQTMFEHIQ